MNAMKKTRQPRHQTKPRWDFRLYIADGTPRSLLAIENLNEFCEKHFAGQYRIEVVDVLAQPQVARADNIVALPTLVRTNPKPARRVIGTLSDSKRMLSGLQMKGPT